MTDFVKKKLGAIDHFAALTFSVLYISIPGSVSLAESNTFHRIENVGTTFRKGHINEFSVNVEGKMVVFA